MGGVLACAGLGPPDGLRFWPFNSVLSCFAILLVPYGLIAWWTSRPVPAVSVAPAPLYKILLLAEWAELGESGRFEGSPLDRASGYIHLCTRAQAAAVAKRRFAGAGPLMVVAVRADAFGERLRWEMLPGGRQYPYLDGPLTADAIVGLYQVEGAEAVDAMLAAARRRGPGRSGGGLAEHRSIGRRRSGLIGEAGFAVTFMIAVAAQTISDAIVGKLQGC
ncbi:DUF952 domain-containing protein [Dactylosporangium sp. McL0621]|uniref:DUF952 domain-containing protein n=1 Tax=Dactylosporangium sp. McL0621 TaxID=3415678 RepID=UPI003CF9E8FE